MKERIVAKPPTDPKYNLHIQVPKGRRHTLKFTTTAEGNHETLLCSSDATEIMRGEFETTLFCGSEFYGTLRRNKMKDDYIIEDVVIYKGYNVAQLCYGEKLAIIYEFLTENKLEKLACSVPKMAIVNSDSDENAKYEVYSNLYTSLESPVDFVYNVKSQVDSSRVNQSRSDSSHNVNSDGYRIFVAIADYRQDVYKLYNMEPVESEFVDYAYIPDYTTSVLMNKYFRKIKENENLDCIEESDDDEDDGESNLIPGAVYQVKCKLHHRFKKWVPVEVIH